MVQRLRAVPWQKSAPRLFLAGEGAGSGALWVRHPSAMSTSTISPAVLTELNRQFNHELFAAHSYQAMSIWCENRNLGGFAEYFAKQATEEREHAGKIIDHLLDRGAQPVLEAIPAPKQEFSFLLEVARHALALETENSRGIHAVYEAALAAKDYPAQVLMHWFISEQVEEEAWCAEMIGRVESATCAGSLGDLDRHIVRLLTAGKE
jgi:ferritin